MFDSLDVREIAECAVAIDFGASNTDVAAVVEGQLRVWTQKTQGKPDVRRVKSLTALAGIEFARFSTIAVTGGHHQALPEQIDGVAVYKVGELAAIARGGQALATGTISLSEVPLLVVSAGSGTAMVAADGHVYTHITGTGVGGGTMLGLGRLLLNTVDPREIDSMALIGDPNAVDLALRDVVTGPIGALPQDATAVNFGRIAHIAQMPGRDDMASALVTLVGQVIATLAINAARGADLDRIVVTGHLTDMTSMRQTMTRVGEFFGMPLELSQQAGYATVIGALLQALAR